MLTEDQKDTIKRYIKAIADVNSDTSYQDDFFKSVVVARTTGGVHAIAIGNSFESHIICPKFMIINGTFREIEISKTFNESELKMIWENVHHIGEVIKDDPIIKEYRLSPKQPYQKGTIGDPFYRMFDEIARGSK